jgi:predicted RNase H-like nuclease/diadenosine tetraphosphate (Ap4A) HIT family hydrolase
MNNARYVGVDGCRAGWFFVSAGPVEAIEFGVFETMDELWGNYGDAELILVDIPIGLQSRGSPPRSCDEAARKLLRPRRHSSVFSPPCREALSARTYAQACRINQEITGRKISIQAWRISAKIRQVDELLRHHTDARGRLRETHPEVCFRALAGGEPMPHAKRTPHGQKQRLALLVKQLPQARGIYQAARDRFQRKQLADDDILDALALLVTATLFEKAGATLPADPHTDARGLPMEMVYAAAKKNYPLPRPEQPKTGPGLRNESDPDCLICRWIKSGRALKTLGAMAVFHDGHPVTEGHRLLVSLRHTPDYFSMTAAEKRDAAKLIQMVAEEIQLEDPTVSGFNIGTNIGASAGQTVFHAHIHLIPRRDGDSPNPRGGVRGVIDGKRGY